MCSLISIVPLIPDRPAKSEPKTHSQGKEEAIVQAGIGHTRVWPWVSCLQIHSWSAFPWQRQGGLPLPRSYTPPPQPHCHFLLASVNLASQTIPFPADPQLPPSLRSGWHFLSLCPLSRRVW